VPINRSPIILLGKGKSGTTAIAALLAEATGKSVSLDIPALFADGIRPILQGRSSLAQVIGRERLAFSNDILKQPTLTWLYEQLRECFPDAKFVMITRDPRDNIRSVLNRMDLRGDLDDLTSDQIGGIHAGWRWHFAEPQLLGLTGGNYIELSAARWNKAVDIYLAHSADFRLMRYEDFMTDRVGSIARLAADLGLPVTTDISKDVDKQFQPRGKDRGLAWAEFFGPRNLAAIETICATRMERIGYAPTIMPAAAAG
jgi:hypothetical protein